MIRIASFALLACLCGVPLTSHAQTAAPSASVKMLFLKPVVLRGTLGDAQIQATLRTKQEFEDGVEGDYFLFGHSLRILLAGEVEGDELVLEESENGTDVSGQWLGKIAGDAITGEWQSANGEITKPFRLRIMKASGK